MRSLVGLKHTGPDALGQIASAGGVHPTGRRGGRQRARHPGWGGGLSARVERGQAVASSSTSRLRVRVKSSGMPGPMVVLIVAFSM